jgi:hypothetical protein
MVVYVASAFSALKCINGNLRASHRSLLEEFEFKVGFAT